MSGPGFHFIGPDERRNVLAALDEGTLTRYRFGRPGGPSFVHRFEREVERSFGAAHCVAVNSGTSALLAALAALEVGPGDEVIVPGYTFIASIAAVVYAGAVPVLAEVDDSLTIDPADVRAKITPRTKAIMPVHMLGVGADLDPVTEIAREHGVVVLEDVAQACGGSYRGRRLGTIGDAGAFSLNYFKVVTAGEGGFLLTGSAARYERAYAFHDHGFRPFREGAVEADTVFGLNLRMADLTGAVALAQVGRIDEVLGRLRTVKERLAEAVGDLPGVRRRTRPDPTGDCATALIYVFDDAEHADKTAALLGTATLISSGRHYYGNMPQLRRLGTGSSRSVPFQDRAVADPDAYRAGSLSRTDGILARSLALSTGTSDTYAGTGFGVLPTSTEAEIDAVAARFRAAVLESA